MAPPVTSVSLIKATLPSSTSLLSSSLFGASLSHAVSIHSTQVRPISPPCPGGLRIQAAKKLQGIVVKAVNDKTVAVEVTRLYAHPKYKKRIKSTKKYQAHDPENACKLGDVVTLIKCAPISKTKTFKVAEVKPGRLPASPKKIGEEILSPFEEALTT